MAVKPATPNKAKSSEGHMQTTNNGKTEVPDAVKARASLYEVESGIAMPEKRVRGGGKRGSKYPFDILEVGQSFHVPKTTDNPDPAAALASSVTAIKRKYSLQVKDTKGNPVMENVEVKVYAVDASGKRLKDPNGKWIVNGTKQVTRPKMNETRDFIVVPVDAKDPKGAGARVWRRA